MNLIELEVTRSRLLRVWWGYFWRMLLASAGACIVAIIAGGLIGALLGFGLHLVGYDVQAIQTIAGRAGMILGLAVGTAFSIIPIKLILGRSFGDFRLVLVSTSRLRTPDAAIPPIPSCAAAPRELAQIGASFASAHAVATGETGAGPIDSDQNRRGAGWSGNHGGATDLPALTGSIGLLFMLAASFATAVHAQQPPIQWGTVPPGHLEMTEYPPDSNATAVILADYGTVSFNEDYSLAFERHLRIKILSEAGFDRGTVSITYLAEGRSEDVRGVKGQTFYLADGGEMKRHELGSKDIFDEKVDGRHRRIRFTLPALQPGAVIEYRYVLNAKNPFLMPDWVFQSSEPTLWSEFRVEVPPRLQFVKATKGMVKPLFIEESTPVTRSEGKAMRHRMVMTNLPAIREEPYMTAPSDYRATIQLQLSGYVDPGYGLTKVLHTWDKVAEDLRKIKPFAQFLNPSKAVRAQTGQIVDGSHSLDDRLRVVYDFVRTSIAWSGEMGVIPRQDLNAVLKTKKGSSPEIAILLAAMLREAGLEANPVLVSTRAHGAVMEIYPLLSQFNDVIVAVRVGEWIILLDATNPLRPYDLLAFEVLGTRGWMVGKKENVWIDITSSSRFEKQTYIEAAVEPSGAVMVHLRRTQSGYSALEARADLRDEGEEYFIGKVLLEGKEVNDVEAFQIEGKESAEGALTSTGTVTIPDYAQAVGDLIYLNPKILDRLEKNPFRVPERTFPVDFGFPALESYTLKLAIPAGYLVAELPANLRLRLPGEGGSYIRSVGQEGEHIILQSEFERKKSVFRPTEYRELRAIYERIVTLESEHIVLRRQEIFPAAPTGEAGAEQ